MVPGHQAINLVKAKPARFVIDNVSNAASPCVSHLKDLVHLLLVFGDGRDDFDLAKEMLKLFERRAWISWHRIAPEQRDRDHAHIEPGTIVAQDEHGLAGRDTERFKTSRAFKNLFSIFGPGGFLPDAAFLFAKRDIRSVARRVPRQQCAERIVPRRLHFCPLNHETLRYKPR